MDLGIPTNEQEFKIKRNLFGEVDAPPAANDDDNNGIYSYNKIINIIEVEARLPLTRIIDPIKNWYYNTFGNRFDKLIL